ncbi:RNA polymerase sigma-70 factor [Negadavirga shengliensis]|uniref:RNA polymerase sigma-70 factor n=1 Tax=Negadavirga shengliensis TaxID=1389218 RepID=A0ABV9SXK8_9BACT
MESLKISHLYFPDLFIAWHVRPLIDHIESDLVKSLRQGDIKAFDELYFRYMEKLLGFAKSYLLDEREAEETVQEIFIKIWEKRKTLDESKNFRSYLFQSVKNHLLNRIRDRRNNCKLEEIPEEMAISSQNIIEDISYKELEETAIGLIKNLPRVQQEVFMLSKMEGLSNGEIALRLNLSKRTIEHHIYLATKFLKGELVHKTFAGIGVLLFFG